MSLLELYTAKRRQHFFPPLPCHPLSSLLPHRYFLYYLTFIHHCIEQRGSCLPKATVTCYTHEECVRNALQSHQQTYINVPHCILSNHTTGVCTYFISRQLTWSTLICLFSCVPKENLIRQAFSVKGPNLIYFYILNAQHRDWFLILYTLNKWFSKLSYHEFHFMDEGTEAQELKCQRLNSELGVQHSGPFAFQHSGSLEAPRGCHVEYRVFGMPGNKGTVPETKEGQGQLQKPSLIFFSLSVKNFLESTKFSLTCISASLPSLIRRLWL